MSAPEAIAVTDEEFEFSGLVAASFEPGEIVPFHPELRPAEQSPKIVEPMDWCGQQGEPRSRPGHQSVVHIVGLSDHDPTLVRLSVLRTGKVE